MEDLKCTACGRTISLDSTAYNDADEPFHLDCLQISSYKGEIFFKPRSICLDCEAVFKKPLIIEVVGEKKRFLCPECKGAQLRFVMPELPGMSLRIKTNISFEENVRLFPSGHPAPRVNANVVDDENDSKNQVEKKEDEEF